MNGKYAVPAFLDVKSKDGNLNLVLCVVSYSGCKRVFQSPRTCIVHFEFSRGSAVAGIGIGLFGCLLSAADHIRPMPSVLNQMQHGARES